MHNSSRINSIQPTGSKLFTTPHTLVTCYIQLNARSIGHGVFGVEEVDVALFLLYMIPALFKTNNLCMILRVPTNVL